MQNKKGELHPRNRHQGSYDFKKLQEICPELKEYLKPNHAGEASIDFTHPVAVKLLNRAILKNTYQIEGWDIPNQYLCPPVPGRADYIHHLADILSVSRNFEIPRGPSIRVLDVGVGANCIYPIIGNREYGWTFVGSDIDLGALESAQKILDANPELAKSVSLRHQSSSDRIFKGILQSKERFDVTLCNPPFHSSAEEAYEVNRRKWRNLGKAAVSNFGGKSNELWCEGGEVAFISRMIQESTQISNRVHWFSSFVSKEIHMPELIIELKKNQVLEYRTIHMAQGQKKSRFIAWTFIGGKTRFSSKES